MIVQGWWWIMECKRMPLHWFITRYPLCKLPKIPSGWCWIRRNSNSMCALRSPTIDSGYVLSRVSMWKWLIFSSCYVWQSILRSLRRDELRILVERTRGFDDWICRFDGKLIKSWISLKTPCSPSTRCTIRLRPRWPSARPRPRPGTPQTAVGTSMYDTH